MQLFLRTPPKTSKHSTNLTMTDNTSTVNELVSYGGGKRKEKSTDISFTPIQDQLKSMNNLFDSSTAKLTAYFASESPSGLATDCVESHKIKRLKKKLETMKEIFYFGKENRNEERVKAKIKTIKSIEDQLEACCDDE